MPKDHGIGASPKRREDVRFLTGAGNYTDDINVNGQAYVHFLRSDRGAWYDQGDRHFDGGSDARRGADFHRSGFRRRRRQFPAGWADQQTATATPMKEPASAPCWLMARCAMWVTPIAAVIAETVTNRRATPPKPLKADIEELPAVMDMKAALALKNENQSP